MQNNNSEPEQLVCEKIGRLGSILINRVETKNKLDTAIYQKLNKIFDEWRLDPHIYAYVIHSADKEHFSTGTDMNDMWVTANSNKKQAQEIFKLQYEFTWTIECYSKPVIALVDGLIHGSSTAIGQFGTHCIAGENYNWALPNIKQGFFPDMGVCRLLATLPNGVGMYLGLTGRSINRADALFLGLIEHCIDECHFESILKAVEESDPIDPIVDGLHQDPGPSELQLYVDIIGRIFTKDSIEEIIEALQTEKGEYKQWAKQLVDELLELSPLSLKVTFEAIKRSANLTPEQNLAIDYELSHHFLDNHDFLRAIEMNENENQQCNWQPSKLEDVTDEMVKNYFTPISTDPLNLPPRELGLNK